MGGGAGGGGSLRGERNWALAAGGARRWGEGVGEVFAWEGRQGRKGFIHVGPRLLALGLDGLQISERVDGRGAIGLLDLWARPPNERPPRPALGEKKKTSSSSGS